MYLLPPTGNLYKANLHCHSTVSDGKFTPEELKELYKAAGYQAIAYTDHRACVPHPDLTDESFVALTGIENAIVTNISADRVYSKEKRSMLRVYPICLTPSWFRVNWEYTSPTEAFMPIRQNYAVWLDRYPYDGLFEGNPSVHRVTSVSEFFTAELLNF